MSREDDLNNFEDYSDEQLLSILIENPKAFTFVYEKHKEYCIVFMKSKMYDKIKNINYLSELEDIYQNAVIVLFEKVKENKFKLYNKKDTETQKFQPSSIRNFLSTICYYQLLKMLKHANPVTLIENFKDIKDWLDEDDEINNLRVKKILEELEKMKLNNEKCYERLKLKYYDNKNMQEIADELMLKTSSVAKLAVARCRDELKKRLGIK